MGLYADIYDNPRGRDPLSCMIPMVSKVLVVNAEGPFEARPGDQKVVIQSHMPGIIRAVPLDDEDQPIAGVMKGYSFIACGDSRFSALCEKLIGARFYGAVALHDRKEN